jgi:hypothetical protein
MRFTINLVTPDNGEKFVIEMENATLTNIQGFLADKPDLTLTLNRTDLEQTMMGVKTLEAQIKDGTAKTQGDISILAKLAATMVEFDPRFEIMPGTKAITTRLAAGGMRFKPKSANRPPSEGAGFIQSRPCTPSGRGAKWPAQIGVRPPLAPAGSKAIYCPGCGLRRANFPNPCLP